MSDSSPPSPSLAKASDTPAPKCVRHAMKAAVQYCAQCGVGLCALCGFLQAGNGVLCPACVVPAGSAALPAPSLTPAFGQTPSPAFGNAPRQPWNDVSESARCATHPNVHATQRCDNCRAFVCSTCDFKVPGSGRLHVCPTCAMAAPEGMSSDRKHLLGWGIALAVVATVVMGLVFGGFFAGSEMTADALGYLLAFGSFYPAVFGFGLSLASHEKGWPNPPIIWIAVIWNALFAAAFIALSVVGSMR